MKLSVGPAVLACMTTTIEDTGIADLRTVYAVRDAVISRRPDLATALTIDGERPRVFLRLPHGAAVILARSTASPTGWSVSSPAVHGTVTPGLGASAMADAMVSLIGLMEAPLYRVA